MNKNTIFAGPIIVFLIFACIVAAIVAVPVFYGNEARSADTGTIAATVSATNLSVSVSDGTVNFGSVPLNTSTSTVGTAETQTVSNLGSNATMNVRSGNATGGTSWTLGTSVGSDTFKMEVSTTTGSSYMTFQASDTYLTASTTFTSLASGPLDFRFTTPNASSDFVQKSITLTVQVSSP